MLRAFAGTCLRGGGPPPPRGVTSALHRSPPPFHGHSHARLFHEALGLDRCVAIRVRAAREDIEEDDDVDEPGPVLFDMSTLPAMNDEGDDDDGDDDDDENDEEAQVLEVLPPVGGETLASVDPPGHRSGYVAIVGRPNAGKSTLMNTLVGMKLSIVTYKPQTTRHRISGILSDVHYQMVLLDTPGVMLTEFNKLDTMMLRSVRGAMANADVVFVIVDGLRDPKGAWEGLVPKNRKNPAPLGVILNKCDLINREEISALAHWFAAQPGVEAVFPASALENIGTSPLKDWALSKLPLGPTLYPKDSVSEHPERFFVAEIIREKIFLQYKQEVPYSTQVWIESHKERDGIKKDLIVAKVYVERQSQVGILVGANGSALKKLSSAAREDIETFLGRPVFLDVGVKVKEGWRENATSLSDLGLDDANRLESPRV